MMCPRCNEEMETVAEDQKPTKRMLYADARAWGQGASVSKTSYAYYYCKACGMPVSVRVQARYAPPGRRARCSG